ncbi:hypothetical protein HYV22_03985 [Candidatus Gottesmanbacteria bacterium]|nr:hypothetical protein [Candidatus Gottesmanbacteria bacterium]
MSDKKSTPYKSPYSVEEVGDGMTPTGYTSRQLYGMEESAQRSVGESQKWLLARKVNTYERGADRDSRSGLEALGFQVVSEADDLFY